MAKRTFLRNIFEKKHKHKWNKERYFNKERAMCWYLRRCECGAVEINNAGPTGDKKWRPFTDEWTFDWEKTWFEAAALVTGKSGLGRMC